MTALICTECGAPLSPRYPERKTTLCRRCACRANGKNPEMAKRKGEALRQYYADRPDRREALGRRRSAYIEAHRSDPAFEAQMAKFAEVGTHNIRTFLRSGEARERSTKTRRERLMGWCPPEYRDEYQRLRKVVCLRAPEARRIIEQQIEHDAKAGGREVARIRARMLAKHEREKRDAY